MLSLTTGGGGAIVPFKGTVSLANQHPADGIEVSSFIFLDIPEDAPADTLQGMTYRANTQRSGVYLTKGVPALKGVRWKFKTEDKIISSPVAVGGVVYVGSLDKNLYAINTNDGKEKWRFATGGAIYSSPTVYSNMVYFGSLDGNLYALNIADGSVAWKVKGTTSKDAWSTGVEKNQPDVACSPAVSYGLVFCSVNGRIRGYNFKTGELVWNSPKALRPNFLGSPLIVDGKIAHNYGDCGFGAFSLRSGAPFYNSKECGNDTKNATGATANGVIYNLGQIGLIYANSVKTGNHLWSSLCGSTAGRTEAGNKKSTFTEFRLYLSAPAVNDTMLVVGLTSGISGTDITSGAAEKEKWFFKTGCRVQASPSIAGNMVYVGDDNGFLHALDIDTGNEKWKFKAGDKIISSAYVGDGVIYFGSHDGYVYALEGK